MDSSQTRGNGYSVTEQERTAYALKDNPYAIEFCNHFFYVCQLWDDLIDKDKEIDQKTISDCFILMLIEMPANPFFKQHSDYLSAAMMAGIIDWLDANDLEKGNDQQKMIAYTLRDSFNTVLLQCAYLIGGKDWVNEIRKEFRLEIFGEPIEKYLESLNG